MILKVKTLRTDSNKVVNKRIKQFKKIVSSFLLRQRKVVSSKYNKTLKIGKSDSLKSLLKGSVENNTDWIDTIILTDSTFKDEFTAIIENIYTTAIIESSKKLSATSAITTDVANAYSIAYSKKYAAKFVKGINETTRTILKDEVTKAVADGLSTTELADNIKFSTAFSETRSDVIARTEIVNANIQGNLESWRQSDLVKEVEWYTGIDERVCPICNSNHKKVVAMGSPFPSGALHPPAHPRCRCDLLPVIF